MNNKVCEKGTRNHPLTEEQKANNKEKSRIRSRVEHIFGFMENSMNGMYVECIGIKRVTAINMAVIKRQLCFFVIHCVYAYYQIFLL